MWTLSEYSGTDTYANVIVVVKNFVALSSMAWDENLFVLPDLVIAMNFSKYDKAVLMRSRL